MRSKPGDPEDESRDGLEARGSRGAPPAQRGPGPSRTQATGAAAAPAARCARAAAAHWRNHYRNEFALLFTKQSCHQKRNKITTYHTLS